MKPGELHPLVGQSVIVEAHNDYDGKPHAPDGRGIVTDWSAGAGYVLFEDGKERHVWARAVTFTDYEAAAKALSRVANT